MMQPPCLQRPRATLMRGVFWSAAGNAANAHPAQQWRQRALNRQCCKRQERRLTEWIGGHANSSVVLVVENSIVAIGSNNSVIVPDG